MSVDNRTEWEFTADDKITKILLLIEERFEGIEDVLVSVDDKLEGVVGGTKGGIIAFNQFSEAARRVRDVLQQSIAVYGEYDENLKELQAITGIAGRDLDFLGERARQNGVDFGVGASQGVEAYKLLASNIEIETIGGVKGLEKLGKEVITLSKAAKIDLPLAANVAASALNQYGESANQANRFVNVLAAGAKFGAAEIPDLAMSLKEAGAVAHQAGIQIEGTVAPLEILSQNSVKGSEAGTALRNVILRLQTVLGKDISKEGLPAILKSLQPRLKDVTFLTKAFGMENINAAQILIGNADAVAQMETKLVGTQTAYEQAAINMSAFNEKVAQTRARVNDLLISLGTSIEPFLTSVLSGLNSAMDWLKNNGSSVISIIKGITAGAIAGGVAWVAFNAQMIIANASLWLTTAAQWALNAAMAANPIGIIIGLIAGLVAGVVWAYNEFDEFRAIIDGLGATFMKVFDTMYRYIKLLMTPIRLVVGFVTDGVDGFNAAKDAIAADAVALKDNVVSIATGDAFMDGYNDSLKKSAEKAKKEGSEEPESPTSPSSVFAPTGGNKGGSPSTIGGGSPAVIGGGNGGPRNITINVMNLVKELNVHSTTVKQGVSNVKNEIVEALTGAVRDSEIAISNG